MRAESEMFELILSVARDDLRVRAVVLNGSRANPNAPRDRFMDFDILYFVTETLSFRDQSDWLERFGERLIMQMPEGWQGETPGAQDKFVYLMQFTDGNRIDLTLYPVTKIDQLEHDSQTIALLDKDGILPSFPEPDDTSTMPQPPTRREYDNCCNEFWWMTLYVAKGLWRDEILYAKAMAEIVREQMMCMLIWSVSLSNGYLVNPGKEGKYLGRYLAPELWTLLGQTFAGAEPADNWQALAAMMDLFRASALPLAEHYGYTYPVLEDQRIRQYVWQMNQDLGLDAPFPGKWRLK